MWSSSGTPTPATPVVSLTPSPTVVALSEQIACSFGVGQRAEIYVMHPDGQWIAFLRYYGPDEGEIWVTDRSGSRIQAITGRGPYLHPEWSR